MSSHSLGAHSRGPLPEALVAGLRHRFGERFVQSLAVCEHHGRDKSAYPAMPPDAVVFAHSTEDVVAVVELCAAHKTSLIPYGAGSSVEGQLLALRGGVSLDLSAMNRVLAVHPEDMTATVQAGVTRRQLNEELRHTGLFFPIDPGANAWLRRHGGDAGFSGTNAVRYGSMRENVLALTVVTATGKVVKTGTRAKKSSAGYDLTRLFVGSEGTLGVITDVTVRLYPSARGGQRRHLLLRTHIGRDQHRNRDDADGHPVGRCEFLCEKMVKTINAYSKTQLREAPTLFFEFEGLSPGFRSKPKKCRKSLGEHGGQDFEWATKPEDRSRLWNARHNAFHAAVQSVRDAEPSIPIPASQFPASPRIPEGASVKLAEAPFPSVIVGHVGDGNFHAIMLIDPDDPGIRGL